MAGAAVMHLQTAAPKQPPPDCSSHPPVSLPRAGARRATSSRRAEEERREEGEGGGHGEDLVRQHRRDPLQRYADGRDHDGADAADRARERGAGRAHSGRVRRARERVEHHLKRHSRGGETAGGQSKRAP